MNGWFVCKQRGVRYVHLHSSICSMGSLFRVGIDMCMCVCVIRAQFMSNQIEQNSNIRILQRSQLD